MAGASLLIWSAPSVAQIGIPPRPTYNMFGGIGLLDMPTSRYAPDGEFSVGFSAMSPAFEHYEVGFQALPWLETTFRYSRLDRYLGDADLYDRSLGVKIRLSKEDKYWPSISVGAQDILGTGAFGGEYFVASKKFGDFDFTGGIGWRGLNGFSSFSNPFGMLFKSFKTSNTDVTTGTFLLKDFFHGAKAGLFGGVSWDTPINGLTLIAEVSGEAYSQERFVGSLDYKTPFNFGFSYQVIDGLQIGGGYFYGSQWGLRATLSMDPFAPEPPARLGTPPPQPHVRSSEESNDAVLSLLQDKTHFYNNWPGQQKSTPQIAVSTPKVDHPLLADALFENAASQDVAVRDVETFGNSLIVDVSGRLTRGTCANFQQMLSAAYMQGFSQVVLMSKDSPDTQLCEPNADNTRIAAQPISYTSSADGPIESAPISGDGDVATDTKAPEDDLQKRIIKAAQDQKIEIVAITIAKHQIEVAFANGTYRNDAEAIGRLLRVLMAESPNEVEKFRIVSTASGIPTIGTTFNRSDIERTLNLYGSGSDLLPLSKIAAVSGDDPLVEDHSLVEYPAFGYSLGPGYRQSLFDPNQPFMFGIYADLDASVNLTSHWNVAAGGEYNIYNNFNLTRVSNSLLPHVRSDFGQYYKKGLNGLSSLQTSYFDKVTPDVYGLARAGYLESMYAGFGAEVLWQPENKRWAVAGALYAVQQRGFDRLFDLRPYKVITGHIGVYYSSPFENLDFAVFAGRYLAGDYGATFRITRRFDSGVEIGVYATLTNVPFHTYGEGSFDKGFIIRIPLEAILPVNTQRQLNMDFSPLTRDGGQMLDNEFSIYDYVRRSSEGELLTHWDQVLRP